MMMSCTKVVTAVAALQLLEQGKWALEDPVSKYLPAFASSPGVIPKNGDGDLEPLSSPITMRMLLTHTSGMCGSRQRLELHWYANERLPNMCAIRSKL